ncbi:hypothetical protein C8J57DRAFT_1251956 [Mycena rebaudengoi]|nr:hypothetical protein C8J57DRAFT_1251956 [Mycena rebaudengoi]
MLGQPPYQPWPSIDKQNGARRASAKLSRWARLLCAVSGVSCSVLCRKTTLKEWGVTENGLLRHPQASAVRPAARPHLGLSEHRRHPHPSMPRVLVDVNNTTCNMAATTAFQNRKSTEGAKPRVSAGATLRRSCAAAKSRATKVQQHLGPQTTVGTTTGVANSAGTVPLRRLSS